MIDVLQGTCRHFGCAAEAVRVKARPDSAISTNGEVATDTEMHFAVLGLEARHVRARRESTCLSHPFRNHKYFCASRLHRLSYRCDHLSELDCRGSYA